MSRAERQSAFYSAILSPQTTFSTMRYAKGKPAQTWEERRLQADQERAAFDAREAKRKAA